MANIMLTDVCNLHCPYCFANEFVNREVNEISVENFKKAVDFIATEANPRVGLIGGEPTLHSHLRELLQIVIGDQRLQNVVLFTNAVKIEEYAKELSHPKFHILVNCNSPEDIGQVAFDKMCDNLDKLINQYYLKERITLGINIYKSDFQYDYLLKLLKKYGFDHVRMSIVVPNTSAKRDFNVKNYFLDIKPKFKEFIYAMLSNGIMPTYDCNKMPFCLLTEDELVSFDTLIRKKKAEWEAAHQKPLLLPYTDAAIYTDMVHCSPVIDIRQDLTAVRCFGLSDCTKVKITDFKTIGDLRNYYTNEIDAYAYKLGVMKECDTCYKRKTLRCSGGCLAFKIKDILELGKQVDTYLGGKRNG